MSTITDYDNDDDGGYEMIYVINYCQCMTNNHQFRQFMTNTVPGGQVPSK